MNITSLHSGFIMPSKGTEYAGAFDIYMPEAGIVAGETKLIGLGFAAEVPNGHVALLMPRSSAGAKFGIELANTCGVIDPDYRGEWKAALRTKHGIPHEWQAGDRLVQFMVVPVAQITLNRVQTLGDTLRGAGGFGSSGK